MKQLLFVDSSSRKSQRSFSFQWRHNGVGGLPRKSIPFFHVRFGAGPLKNSSVGRGSSVDSRFSYGLRERVFPLRRRTNRPRPRTLESIFQGSHIYQVGCRYSSLFGRVIFYSSFASIFYIYNLHIKGIDTGNWRYPWVICTAVLSAFGRKNEYDHLTPRYDSSRPKLEYSLICSGKMIGFSMWMTKGWWSVLGVFRPGNISMYKRVPCVQTFICEYNWPPLSFIMCSCGPVALNKYSCINLLQLPLVTTNPLLSKCSNSTLRFLKRWFVVWPNHFFINLLKRSSILKFPNYFWVFTSENISIHFHSALYFKFCTIHSFILFRDACTFKMNINRGYELHWCFTPSTEKYTIWEFSNSNSFFSLLYNSRLILFVFLAGRWASLCFSGCLLIDLSWLYLRDQVEDI